MPLDIPLLTDEQVRRIRDNIPVLSNRPDGNVDLADILNDLVTAINVELALAAPATDLALISSGVATVLDGDTTIVVAVGAALNGKPVVATFGEAPSVAVRVVSAIIAAGNLTITINADNTADLAINYIIDGR